MAGVWVLSAFAAHVSASALTCGSSSISKGHAFSTRSLSSSSMKTSPNPLDSMAERTFVRRAGEPGDVVGAAIYLLSDEAGYVTGSNLVVDGGMTVLV
jgi:NAD(P)-dependent dehydrogenase (short-subunit alcohol dehydrogenase family)